MLGSRRPCSPGHSSNVAAKTHSTDRLTLRGFQGYPQWSGDRELRAFSRERRLAGTQRTSQRDRSQRPIRWLEKSHGGKTCLWEGLRALSACGAVLGALSLPTRLTPGFRGQRAETINTHPIIMMRLDAERQGRKMVRGPGNAPSPQVQTAWDHRAGHG